MSPKRKAKPPPDLAHIAADLRPLAVPIERVKLDPQNARTHDARNVSAIAASLQRFGQRKPIVVNAAGGLVEAGHGTLLAARRLGWTHVAAVRVKDDPATARGFSIADNRTAELAGWDEALLEELLAQVAGDDAGLYDDLLLAELQGPEGRPPTELKRLDTMPPPPMTWVLIGLPTVRFGELSQTIESLAGVEGIILESTVNDGNPDPKKDRQRKPAGKA